MNREERQAAINAIKTSKKLRARKPKSKSEESRSPPKSLLSMDSKELDQLAGDDDEAEAFGEESDDEEISSDEDLQEQLGRERGHRSHVIELRMEGEFDPLQKDFHPNLRKYISRKKRLQLLLNGHVLDSDLSIYQAVQMFSDPSQRESSNDAHRFLPTSLSGLLGMAKPMELR